MTRYYSYRLPHSEKDFLEDRLGPFGSYVQNRHAIRSKMAKVFSAACSALGAFNTLHNDRSTGRVTATIPSMTPHPLRLDFSLLQMSSEADWTGQRSVHLWVVGASVLLRVRVVLYLCGAGEDEAFFGAGIPS
ncbi:unnamed protein product [Heligmosomoides polygyrus]|uniref:PI3K/PI4K domain-containing protein n=1 Tax=Heligmosomoides polygyrus TaxID=6339 RepID=A0A183FHX4_HELPZ|nr:unnamed protein product [Heligmosomoides polygyrus]